MKLSHAGKAAAVLLFSSLFIACGEMNTLLSPEGSYQVRTLVNDNSVEDCSIIRSNDKIRPYFATSVVNDPDLVGLLVYLEDANGAIAGERVRYTLSAYAVGAGQAAQTETEIETETETETPAAPTVPAAPAGAGEAESPNEINNETNNEDNNESADETDAPSVETEEEESEKKGRGLWDLPEEGAIMERRVFTDTKPEVKSTDVEIIVKSFVQELPYFPLPKALGIGTYTLVFEALGERETLSRTETEIFYIGSVTFNLKDIAIYLPEVSGSQLIPPGTTVMLEAGIDFDSRLDPYVIWYNGRTVISQGKISDGAGKILWKAPEQAGFYSVRLEALPYQLKRSFSGFFREASLPVSPKAASAGYFFDNSVKHTAQRSLSSGTAYQEQVRLAMNASATENSGGKESKDAAALPATMSTVIPAEQTTVVPTTVPTAMPLPPELLRWYRLGGNLIDTLSPLESQSLVPLDSTIPRWTATGQSYGLSIGADDAYSLPSINFFHAEKDQGGGIFLFHITPPAEGPIFNVFFPLQSSATDGVWMNMARENNVMVLRLSAGRSLVEMPVYIASSGLQDLIPVVVEFYIRPYRLEAKLSLGEASHQQSAAKYILLPGALTGEARIRLGYQQGKTVQMREVKSGFVSVSPITEESFMVSTANPTIQTVFNDLTESPAEEISFEITEYYVPVDTIWNEFAVLFSATPLAPEENFAASTPETETVSAAKGVESSTEEQLESNTAENAAESAVSNIAPGNKIDVFIQETELTNTPIEPDYDIPLD